MDVTGGARVLVTGASGLVGRALVARLQGDGVGVHALTRVGGARGALPDGVTRHDAIAAAMAAGPYQAIYNCAAAGVSAAATAEELEAVNAALPAALLEACDAESGAVMVHLGSCFELDPESRRPDGRLDETQPLRAWSPYGASKISGTERALAAAARTGVSLRVLRPFMVYGPGEPPHRLIPAVVRALRGGEPVDLTDGRQELDWLYVDDLVEALIDAPRAAEPGPYHVCTGRGTSVREVAVLLAELCDADPDLLRFGARPRRVGEPDRLVGDPARFQAATGWAPRVALRDGLARVIAALPA